MGGQACVFYGAAEFSRDTDLLILADAATVARLEAALHDLQAERIAVPPLALDYLQRGHAVHFRYHHPEAADIQVDVMSRLRGVEEFEVLWSRRTTLTETDGTAREGPERGRPHVLATVESGTGAVAPFSPIQVSDRHKSARWASAHAEESQQVHGQRKGVLSHRSSPYTQLCI
jgi:hypothetical protein